MLALFLCLSLQLCLKPKGCKIQVNHLKHKTSAHIQLLSGEITSEVTKPNNKHQV